MVTLHKVPVIFTSCCISKLLNWILVLVKEDAKLKCYLFQLKDLGHSSLEQYIIYKPVESEFNLPSHEHKKALANVCIRVGKEIEEGFEDLGAHKIAEFIFILDNVAH